MPTSGNFHNAAMFRLEKNVPMLVAPSPRKQETTLGRFRYWFASANPAASGTCPPTIAYPPQIWRETSARCIETPLPLPDSEIFDRIAPPICCLPYPPAARTAENPLVAGSCGDSVTDPLDFP